MGSRARGARRRPAQRRSRGGGTGADGLELEASRERHLGREPDQARRA